MEHDEDMRSKPGLLTNLVLSVVVALVLFVMFGTA